MDIDRNEAPNDGVQDILVTVYFFSGEGEG